MPARSARAPRADNRLPLILDEAARLFRARGFHGTSMRDIVGAVDMLPGSLYYHFATKEALLAAVYAEGVRRISEAVSAAIAAQARSVGAARSARRSRTSRRCCRRATTRRS